MNPGDWCELRFLAMSVIALIGLWHIYLVRAPARYRRWEDEPMERIRQFFKVKIKRKDKKR